MTARGKAAVERPRVSQRRPGYVDLSPIEGLTCAQCGSPSRHVPVKEPKKLGDAFTWMAFMKEAVKVICPHCTPIPENKWPVWEHGRVVKACECGSATCPVPTYAARMAAR
jgi:hypothetical protein